MAQKEEFYTEEEKRVKKEELQSNTSIMPIIAEQGFNFQAYSRLNDFIQYAIGGNVQGFIDIDSNGKHTLNNGIIKFGYGRKGEPLKNKDNAEIVVFNSFTGIEVQEVTEKVKAEMKEIKNIGQKVSELLYKPLSKVKEFEKNNEILKTDYSILMKKVELYFVQKLYNSLSIEDMNNKWISATDMELAKAFGVSRNFINQSMNSVLIGLSQFQIRKYTHKKIMSRKPGVPIPELALVNLIQEAYHRNGETQILFNDNFAKYIVLCSPLQIPKELYQIKNALAYDMALYLYGQVREKKENVFKIKIETLYNTILQIKRIEDVKSRNYQRDIYKPVETAFDILGFGSDDGKKVIKGLQFIQINYENTDFIEKNGTYKLNKWLDTNLIINMLKVPNYDELRANRNQHRQKAIETKEKAIKKAIEKQIIKESQPEIDKIFKMYQSSLFDDM